MKVVYSPKFLEFSSPGHPESSERVRLIYEELKKSSKFEFIEPTKAKEEDLLLVHDKSLIEKVKNNTFSDPDTPNIRNIYDYALLSVGAAIKAAEIALSERLAFSLARPPGHHATRNRIGGFCYFNNIAVAVAKLLQEGRRVAILDLDVHHGNGTQDIFLEKKGVIFCSLHKVPLYPGTGLKSENKCFNFPLPGGADGTVYIKELQKAIKKIKDFAPEILAVSLGFDTYIHDPLANICLEKEDYRKIGEIIRNLNLPTFFVLEGGYSRDVGILVRIFLAS